MKQILLLCLFLAGCTLVPEIPVYIDIFPSAMNDTITIAHWNLQVFGPKKAGNDLLLDIYDDIMDEFDVVFIQEIRDASQTAFPTLCALLEGYDCTVSTRAGRSSSKEQIGVIFRNNLKITSWEDFNPDAEDRWERPPLKVGFEKDGYAFTVYAIHIKPDDAQQELYYLEEVIEDEGNTLIIGDLNADCSYYDNAIETEFDDWAWLIQDHHDTTVAKSSCAYDRILLNADAFADIVAGGIIREGITKAVSDHYLIWTQLKASDSG